MTSSFFKKLFAGIGIAFTVAHFFYYVIFTSYNKIAPYDSLYFFLGFGLLWLVFVLPMKYWK